MITYLVLAYLLMAVIVLIVWGRQDKFPDERDFIDNVFIILTVLLWPITLSILAWMLYANRKD